MSQNQVFALKITDFPHMKNSLRKRKLLSEYLHIRRCRGIISVRKFYADYLYVFCFSFRQQDRLAEMRAYHVRELLEKEIYIFKQGV